jgi:DNA-binding HxlR family transcriptional regulator
MKKNASLLQKRLRKLSKTLRVVRNRQAYVPVRVENVRLGCVQRGSNS